MKEYIGLNANTIEQLETENGDLEDQIEVLKKRIKHKDAEIEDLVTECKR